MEKVKVSVIIPVYNTAVYLSEAIGSIRRQTLTELEIIAINDGSTDDSLYVLENLQKEEPRLKVYSQANKDSQQPGMLWYPTCRRRVSLLLDSDDFLSAEALEACYTTAIRQQSDIVFFDALIMDRISQNMPHLPYQRKEVFGAGIDSAECPGPVLLKELMKQNKFSASPCLNFISAKYLKKKQLQFYPGIIHEDQLFTFLLYLQADRISYLSQDYFHRRIREASTMTSPVSMRNISGYLTVCKELKGFKQALLTTEQQALIQLQIKTLVNIMASTAITLPFGSRMAILKELLQHFPGKLRPQSILLLLLPCLKLKKNKPL